MGNACKQQALDIIEITQVDYISESQRNEHESIKIIWDSKTERFLKTRLKIKKKLNKEIEYQEGCESFIKIDSFKNFSVRPKKSINLEYIQNHKWIGQYGKKMQKIGKWTESWKGQKLKGVGGYYSNDGKKEGYWNELIKNYWSRGQVQELGEYFNNQRRGVWKYIYFNNIIDGGLYNEQGQRNGKWTELSDKFWDCSQIIYHGEYKNGNKVGRWDIYFENKLIGGGQFYENQRSDVVKNVIKIGRWIEPSDWFYNQSRITYDGQYVEGRKIGRWDIWFQKNHGNNQKKLIGGGQYDEEQSGYQFTDSIKVGKWTELFEGFCRKSQITYIGEYQNGKKVGRWDIFYKDLWTKKNYLIGGGQYNIKQDGGLIVNSNKNGKWIELNDGFWSYGQVFYSGDYINGNKQGRWDIYFKDEWKYENELIGGGTYIIEQDENNIVNSHKIGNWIELSDNFGNGFGQQQILYSGQYKNCQKIGIWYIMKRDKYKMEEGFKRSKKIFSYPNFIL